MKVAVVGNGVLGAMTARAWRAASPEVSVVLVGPSLREGSATRAAAAMLNSFTELEYDSLRTPLDRFKFDLSRRATEAWPEIFDDICGPEGPYGFGTFVINNTATDRLDDDNFAAVLGFCEEFAEPVEMVDPADIPNYSPDPRYRALKALHLPREGWVNPKFFLDRLTERLAADAGVTLVDAEVTGVERGPKGLSALQLSDGRRIDADEFVFATGASLTSLLSTALPELDIQRVFYGVGMSVEIDSPTAQHTHCVRTTNRGLACGVYTAPYGGSRILVGATNFMSTGPRESGQVGSAYSLLKSAMDQINTSFMRADLVGINVGWRPTTSDTYPLIGQTSVENVWVIGGTKRDGFHLSPVICADLVEAMRGRAIDERYQWLAPERPLIRNLSRQDAIDKGVRHQINASLQHDFVPARNRMVEQLEASIRADLEALHDQVGADTWGIPIEMADMYRYGHIPGTRSTL